MVNVKRKGSQWERDLAKRLMELIPNSIWKRIPGSGALGTILKEPLLVGDVKGRVEGIEKEFRIEAKVGYGGAKQMAVKKEWLDKIKEEAATVFGIPLLIGKFSGAREGIKHFVAMDLEVFAELINKISEQSKLIDEYWSDKSE